MENKQGRMCQFKVEPIRKVFYSQENAFGIYACNVLEEIKGKAKYNKYGNITLKGIVPELELYKSYNVECREAYDKRWGNQYEFTSINVEKPSTSEEQYAFLSSLLTELQVENIFKVYDKPIDKILNDEFDYTLVHGFGKHTYRIIKERIEDNFVFMDLIAGLKEYNVTLSQVKAIYNKYKNAVVAIEKIKKNPYILYKDIKGIGFKRADKIALSQGIGETSDIRIDACIHFCLNSNQQEGHTWMHMNDLALEASELLGIKGSLVVDYLNKLESGSNESDTIKNKYIVINNDIVAFRYTYNVERIIKEELIRLDNSKPISLLKIDSSKLKEIVEHQEKKQGFSYTEQQKEVFKNIFIEKEKVNIVIGNAGSGKSTILKGLHNVFEHLGLTVNQFSFAGKAAQIMADYTNRNASTVHRGLGWTPIGFRFNKENKLKIDVMIIDELSLMDIFLFKSVLEALPDHCILLVLGDTAQLESINAGNILHDMINSQMFSTVTLKTIFRQTEESGILQLANNIRQGKYFLNNDDRGYYVYGDKKDAMILCDTKENTKENIIKCYKNLLKEYKSNEIMTIIPIKRGDCGVFNMNKVLQDIANPRLSGKREITFGKGEYKKLFREGDICIHIENNYKVKWLDENFNIMHDDEDMHVYNGEMGVIIKIDNLDRNVFIDFGDRIIKYEYFDLKDLELGYVLTVHKCQGSEFKATILALDTNHFYQAKRSLLYTGVTRSQKTLVMCADPKVINKAISYNPIVEKRTFLYKFLLDDDKLIQ